MGILKGGLSVRRYHVQGELPDSWRDTFIDALQNNAFREPLTETRKDASMGWVQIHNLLDHDFADINRWLYNQYAVFALRIDKKVLPAKLFKAHFEKRQAEWCKANNRDRCPPGAREELKELLEFEMLQKTLPRVQLFELAWNTTEGWLIFHNDSEVPNDTFRKHFYKTFGFRLMPWLPIDELSQESGLGEQLMSMGASDLREGE